MRRKTILVSVILASLLATTSVAAAPAISSSTPAAWSAPGYHMVRAGETVFSIGRLYGVSPWAIANVNHLPDSNKIYVGQWLYIPSYPYYSPYRPGYYPSYRPGRYHWVTSGETLHSIGRMYGVNPWAIASANGIYNLNYIYAGQRLLIPYHS
jgi:cortical fragment-lytic enzyme